MSDETHHEDEYDDAMVTMLELIWGEGFLSPGGPEATLEIVRGLDLDGKSVLDIGCGIGGPAMVLVRERGCRVIGLDLEAPLIARARGGGRMRSAPVPLPPFPLISLHGAQPGSSCLRPCRRMATARGGGRPAAFDLR
jgi:phosphoethanolamine N-methyltransferase